MFPVLLSGPLLKFNMVVIDHKFGWVMVKDVAYQLLPLSVTMTKGG